MVFNRRRLVPGHLCTDYCIFGLATSGLTKSDFIKDKLLAHFIVYPQAPCSNHFVALRSFLTFYLAPLSFFCVPCFFFVSTLAPGFFLTHIKVKEPFWLLRRSHCSVINLAHVGEPFVAPTWSQTGSPFFFTCRVYVV